MIGFGCHQGCGGEAFSIGAGARVKILGWGVGSSALDHSKCNQQLWLYKS